MNSGFASENNVLGRRRNRKEDHEESKASNDASDEVQSCVHDKPEGRKQEPEKPVSVVCDANFSDQTEGDESNDVKPIQATKDDSKDELDTEFGKMGSNNSSEDNKKRDNFVKRDLPNWKVNSINYINVEEDLNDCCQRKRKRCEIECDGFSYKFQGSGLTCIGILPGLSGNIDSSDDSDQSCSSGSEANENVKYDLLGRSIVYENKCETETR